MFKGNNADQEYIFKSWGKLTTPLELDFIMGFFMFYPLVQNNDKRIKY